MRLCTVALEDNTPHFGLELKNRILRVAAAARALGLKPADQAAVADSMAFFANLPKSDKVLRGILQAIAAKTRQLSAKADDGLPLALPADSVRYLPPIARPGKFLCVGLNYRDHCEEQKAELPTFPMIFNKYATSLIGHGATIPLPIHVDERMDYEGELAIVIGKTAKNVTKRAAMKHVAGYSIVNDVTARTLQKSERQWARAKGFDGAGPFGPVIVTPDEIEDPHNLRIQTLVNGEVRQSSNTSQLIFNIPAIIAHVAQMITLEPGDVISTGTAAGVGVYRNPPTFLKPGDVVEIRVDHIGALKNACVSAK